MKSLIRRLVLWAIADDLRAERKLATHNAVANGIETFAPKVVPPPVIHKVGDRVKGSELCRFHRGFTGVVKYVEPNGTLWVLRDGAGSDVFYHPEEVEHE